MGRLCGSVILGNLSWKWMVEEQNEQHLGIRDKYLVYTGYVWPIRVTIILGQFSTFAISRSLVSRKRLVVKQKGQSFG